MTNPILPLPTDEELRAWDAACEAATAAPWEQLSGQYMAVDQGRTPQRFVALTEADEAFILTARTALPRLLAAVAHWKVEAERMREERDALAQAGWELHQAFAWVPPPMDEKPQRALEKWRIIAAFSAAPAEPKEEGNAG